VKGIFINNPWNIFYCWFLFVSRLLVKEFAPKLRMVVFILWCISTDRRTSTVSIGIRHWMEYSFNLENGNINDLQNGNTAQELKKQDKCCTWVVCNAFSTACLYRVKW
jgi:hypothetical protein